MSQMEASEDPKLLNWQARKILLEEPGPEPAQQFHPDLVASDSAEAVSPTALGAEPTLENPDEDPDYEWAGVVDEDVIASDPADVVEQEGDHDLDDDMAGDIDPNDHGMLVDTLTAYGATPVAAVRTATKMLRGPNANESHPVTF